MNSDMAYHISSNVKVSGDCSAHTPGGVQRWAKEVYHERPDEMVAAPDGDWVRYGDIAGMAGENERMRKALTRIAKPHDHGCYPVCQCNFEDEMNGMRDYAREALRGAAGEAHFDYVCEHGGWLTADACKKCAPNGEYRGESGAGEATNGPS